MSKDKTKAQLFVEDNKRRQKAKAEEAKAKVKARKKAEDRDAEKAKEYNAQKLSRNVDKGPEAK